jgi:DNA polymerase-3 subunit alpha
MHHNNSLISQYLQKLKQNKLASAGLLLILALIVVAIAAPLVAPYDPVQQHLAHRLNSPSASFLFGTDDLGRDVFSRMVHGVRISLTVGLVAVGISVIIGTLLGLVSGYFGGWVDAVIMRLVDIMLCFPTFFLILLVIAFLQPSIYNVMAVIGLTSWPGLTRLVRAEVLSIREREYVHAARQLIKNSHMMQLIKGGCFDSFSDRKSIMKEFVKHTFEPKKQLNMQNMKMLIENDLIPEENKLNVRFFNFKNYISQSVHKTIPKPKDRLFLLDNIATPFFEQHFSEDCIVDVVDGSIVISEKKFKKEYDKHMECLKDWLNKEETVQQINETLLNRAFEEFENDSISKWEMDSLSYYYHDHELAVVDNKKYGLENFNELPEQPIVVNEYVSRGIPRQEFKLSRIAGTVLDRDKNKHQVTVLTTDGVVTVKFYAGAFSHYNKQISKQNKDKKEILETSWFTRGNKLLFTGFRRGNKFVPRKYKDSIYQHTVALIKNIDQDGNLILQTERVQI